MKLKKIYQEIINKGIEADPRSRKEVESLLRQRRSSYQELDKKEKVFFDEESLCNPFSDTRILNGSEDADIRRAIVGIDVEGPEILLVDKLREKGNNIDLIISHHPAGKAYANFYEVMDLQIDIFRQKGINLSFAEDLLNERKAQVARRVGSANHQRPVDIARWLEINLMCVHTPADNLAYRYIEKAVKKEKPKYLGKIIDMLLEVPEYKEAAMLNNPPVIFLGSKRARVSNVHIEFTGGTEGPKDIYDRFSSAGIDTIIAMHQSEEHFKKCKEAHINVIVASHIASDTLGMNLMLDYLLTKGKFEVCGFSGFKRFSHK